MKLIDLIFRMNYTLLQGSLEQDITEVIYDSRKAVPGCIFLCLPGAVTDGHKYIPDVLEKGAVALVVEQDVKVPEHITVLKVVCDPLPEGVSGRKCELHVQGKTCKSTYPIEVLQGDAVAGVNGVTVNVARDGKTYNVSGQRVADDTKGLVIRNGKKYLNK